MTPPPSAAAAPTPTALSTPPAAAAAGAMAAEGAARVGPPRWPRPLLIDNYDSYTYNLHQMIAEVYGVSPLVIRNDELPAEGVLRLLGRLRDEAAAAAVTAATPLSAPPEAPMPHVIISPGPGNPHRPADAGVSVELFAHPAAANVPILGVCLGHQALAVAHGARVVATEGGPVHGRLSRVRADPLHPLFAGCGGPEAEGAGGDGNASPPPPPPFRVVRYHSLAVDPASLPADSPLRAIAWADVGGDEPVALRAVEGVETAKKADDEEEVRPPVTPGQEQPPKQKQRQSIIMALAHADRPHCGVQFHPESIATAYGARMLANFRDLALKHQGLPPGPALPAAVALGPPGTALAPRPWPAQAAAAAQAPPEWLFPQGGGRRHAPLRLAWQRREALLPLGAAGAAACLPVFEAVVGGGGEVSAAAAGREADAFWLDSATAPERARFSFMGGGSRLQGSRGPLWHRVAYRVAEQQAQRDEEGGGSLLSLERPGGGGAGGGAAPPPRCLWSYLRAATGPGVLNDADARAAALELPFNFWGGAVGYLGYELGHETLPRPHGGGGGGGGGDDAASLQPAPRSPVPDAVLLFADRLVAVDHERGDVYALALHEDEDEASEAAANQWLRAAIDAAAAAAAAATDAAAPAAAAAVAAPAPPAPAAVAAPAPPAPAASPEPPSFVLRHGREEYVRNVAACLDALKRGDSYELCLTTALQARRPAAAATADTAPAAAPVVDPWLFYRVLRAINPAPYSAWLRFPAAASPYSSSSSPLTIACSSPERFLRGDRGGVLEARPIKGTARRVLGDPDADAEAARALASSEKERSENLMIVDLLRNDLSEVCTAGSVHVPGLIELESYATVHQLVSTVRGLLREEGEDGGGGGGGTAADSVAAVRAAFPGGSMTGAPKLRSCDILARLEGAPRGIYSGAIGYFSVAPGAPFDLNIVIRTACFYEEEEEEREARRDGGPAAPAAAAAAAEAVMSIGAGGAIVIQSDPGAEYAEMRLKASALVRATAATWLLQQQQQQQGGESRAAAEGPLRLPPAAKVEALAATMVTAREGGAAEADT